MIAAAGLGQGGCPGACRCAGDGVGGAGGVEALVDLGADQLRVGEQPGDVVPDDRVEVVGADGLVGADPAALVAVVVGAQAPVVVDLLVGGAGGGAVVAVSAAAQAARPCSSEGTLLLREAKRLLSASRCATRSKVVLADDGRHRDLGPLLAGPVDGLGRAWGGAALQPGDPVQARGLVRRPWSCRTPRARRRRGCAACPRPRSGPSGACRCGWARRCSVSQRARSAIEAPSSA